tara:strand:+ start:954 stop:2891 length:1938 start_codon:yes stop_codon:yes gene_type:complete
MTIIIPNRLILDDDNRTYTLGREQIKLDASDLGQTSNPMFRLMLDFLLNPVSKGDYNKVERHIKRFLNQNFMDRAADQTADMKWDSEEYKDHIERSWELLMNMDVSDFFELIKTKFQRDGGDFTQNDLNYVINNLGNDELPMKEYLTREGFNKITGAGKKGSVAGKIRRTAEAKGIYEEALNELEDFIKIEVKQGDTIHAGGFLSTKDEEKEIRNGTVYRIMVYIDTNELWKKVFNDAGMDMNLKKSDSASPESLQQISDAWARHIDKDDLYEFDIQKTQPTIEDLMEFQKDSDLKLLVWLPKDIKEKAEKSPELEEMIVNMNLKLAWNDDRRNYEDVPIANLDDDELSFLMLLFNADIIKPKSINRYVTTGIIPSERQISTKQKNFFKKEVAHRAKEAGANLEPDENDRFKVGEGGFSSEYEEMLWRKYNKRYIKGKMNIVVNAPETSKWRDRKLFKSFTITGDEHDTNIGDIKIDIDGFRKLREIDTSDQIKQLYKDILNPNSIGLHTLQIDGLAVQEVYIKQAEMWLNQPTMPSGPSSEKNKKTWRELLDNRWNVFKVTDIKYDEKNTPYLSNLIEVAPETRRYSGQEDMRKPKMERYTAPKEGGFDRSGEGGAVGMISMKSRVFNNTIRKQLRRLKRYIDG